MKKLIQIFLIIALLVSNLSFGKAYAAVERNDLIPLGAELGFPVYEWKDNSVETKAIFVGFHGMTFYGLAMDDLGKHMASQGYPFYSFDYRGFGHWRDKDPKYPGDGEVHFGPALEDGKALIKALHAQYPNYKIFCIGESLGSNLIVWGLAQETLPVDGAILCGLGIKNWLHPQPKWVSDFIIGFTNHHKPLNLIPYIKPNLASDKEVTKIYLNDPKIHNKLSTTELFKAMITNKKSVQQMELIPDNVSFLIMSGEHDRMFKSKSVADFAKILGPEQATCKLIPGRGHLLLELHPLEQDVAGNIDTWLDSQVQMKETQLPVKDLNDQGAMQPKETAQRML